MGSALLLLAVSIAVPGCSGDGPRPLVLGFLVKLPEELWFQNEWKFAQRCADRYGFELLKIGTPDGERVLSAIDTLAARGAKGFVVCAPDVRLGPAIVAKAESHGLKVYSVDDQLVGFDGAPLDVPYMGISARAIGETVGKALWGEMARRGWPIEGTAACAITYDELATSKERTDGSTAALVAAGFPADRIHRGALRTTDVPGAIDAANAVLTRNPDVERWLVFSVNDEGVLGAVRAFEGRGFGADAVIGIGIGAGSGTVEFEKEAPTGFFATCLLNPYRHGYETTERLYRWVTEGTPPPRDIRTEGTIITRENYAQALKDAGLQE
ncbi:MAG: substrate-binding domain-containing protein [Planctomycetes bacterium]|nr:substrate-binding domain-containing protein [Planctomycetota bacterium]